MKRSVHIFLIIIVSILLSAITSNAERVSFIWENGSMTFLGSLGGSMTEALDINNAGQVVGWSSTSSGAQPAFMWQNGSIRALPNLVGGGGGRAEALNELGQVVGYCGSALGGRNACLWDNGTVIDLGGRPGTQSTGYGINNSGQVVGNLAGAGAFLWQNGSMTILLGGNFGGVSDINDSGQIVGQYGSPENRRAFVLQNGQLTDLGSFGGTYNDAWRINDLGQIIGFSTDSLGIMHSFLWENGEMIDLGTTHMGYDINNLGQVLSTDGFLWQNGEWKDLKIISTETYQLTTAINDQGQIVGLMDLLPVLIDIKPGDSPNSINPKSNGKIPVAILSTKNFDAISQVDPNSLTFGRTGDERSLAFCHGSEDVNKDGLQDLVCHFYTQDTGFQCGDTKGILKGETEKGTPIKGGDSVKVGPCK